MSCREEHYKEDGFKDNVYFSVDRMELDEKLFQECLDEIKPLLFNEKSSVLMMATNRIIIDLSDQNEHVVAMSLSAIGELSTEDMCRAFSIEISKVNKF